MAHRSIFFGPVILLIAITITAHALPYYNEGEDEYDLQQQQQKLESDELAGLVENIGSRKRLKGGREPKLVQKTEKNEQDPCLAPKIVGRCKSWIPRYYFNVKEKKCEVFYYGGCHGNANNFEDLRACELQCSHLLDHIIIFGPESPVPQTSQQVLELCDAKPEKKSDGESCGAIELRWTFNRTEGQCVQYIYTGCGETGNSYRRKSDCDTACSAYKAAKKNEETCSMPKEIGRCFARKPRFFFNKDHNRCELFYYGGCGGNDNNFMESSECLRTCGGDTPSIDEACVDADCQWSLFSHYKTLNCKPVYDGNSCCPTRFDCPDRDVKELESPKKRQCSYRGKKYNIGEKVPEADDESNCRTQCLCLEQIPGSDPRVICADIECPEVLGGPPPGKENCLPLYNLGHCCAYDYYCPKNETSETQQIQVEQPYQCQVDGESYFENERFYPNEDQCKKCICKKGFLGKLSDEFCEKIDCALEIYYSDKIAKGCAPVYLQSKYGPSCCPVSWKCPDEAEKLSVFSHKHDGPRRYDNIEGPYPNLETMPHPVHHGHPHPELKVKGYNEGFTFSNVEDFPRPDNMEVMPHPAPDRDRKGRKIVRYVPLTVLDSRKYSDDLEVLPFPILNGAPGTKTSSTGESYDNLETMPRPVPDNFEVMPEPVPDIKYAPGEGYSGSYSKISIPHEACSLQKAPGNCAASRRRYFFNQETKKCEQFSYTGCNGNANNFVAKDDCERLCSDVNNPSRSGKKYSDLKSNSIHLTELDPCTRKPRRGFCKAFIKRFYFSAKDNACKTFIYGGCNGNENNFHSQDACEATCSNTILLQEDLKTSVKVPEEPFDLSAISVMAENNDCEKEPEIGICKAYIKKFYYDGGSGRCKSFIYGGCGGNNNNFETQEDCMKHCSKQSDKDSGDNLSPVIVQKSGNQRKGKIERCHLPKSTGPCLAIFPSYYFDVETGRCKAFNYGGCLGNANRFATKSHCELECGHLYELYSSPQKTNDEPISFARFSPNKPSKPKQPIAQLFEEKVFCGLPAQRGECKSNELRYYYDQTTKSCKAFPYSGCGGNRNNFETESECLSSCGSIPTIEHLSDEGILACTYGNESIPLGDVVLDSGHSPIHTNKIPCGEPVCLCATPPAVTCVQVPCTQEPQALSTCQEGCTPKTDNYGTTSCDCSKARNVIKHSSKTAGVKGQS